MATKEAKLIVEKNAPIVPKNAPMLPKTPKPVVAALPTVPTAAPAAARGPIGGGFRSLF